MSESARDAVVNAVLYAMRCGCFFPVPEPTPPYTVEQLTQWGAMRHLHDAVAALQREPDRRPTETDDPQ